MLVLYKLIKYTIMEKFKSRAANGEEIVTVVKFRKNIRRNHDTLDFTHPSIRAVIPCWKSGNTYTSVKTGLPVQVTDDDEVRSFTRGTAACYPDGTEIVYGMNYRDNVLEFIKREKNQGATLKCFGEE